MKLSIIVPCYNVAPYLERCFMSLTNQTLTDIEILCIDDCSTDNTLEILQQWARLDLRIRVIENDENRGVAYTRNRGIDMARGEFVGFVDPDDWIDADFYKKLIDVAEKTQTPVVCGTVVVYEVDGRTRKENTLVKKNFHEFRYHYSAVYLRDLLNRYNLHYPNLSICEDSVFEASVRCHVSKPIIWVKNARYHYCKRIGSLDTLGSWPESKLKEYIAGVGQIIDIYNMADHVSRDDYMSGVLGYLYILSDYIFYTKASAQYHPMLAVAMIDLFPRFKYQNDLHKRNPPLYLAVLSRDVNGVVSVLRSQWMHKHRYFLFDKWNILTVHSSKLQTRVELFGIKIWGRRTN